MSGTDTGAASVPRETLSRLETFVALLRRWNGTIRLTSADWSTFWDREIAGSLALHGFMPPDVASALDIGSGNGLPAIPLSIAHGIPYQLVESDKRKAAFLREVARATGAPLTIVGARIEDVPVQPYDVITARAFGSLSRLIAIAAGRQHDHTVCLFPKGPDPAAELAEAAAKWSFDAICEPVAAGTVVAVRRIVPR